MCEQLTPCTRCPVWEQEGPRANKFLYLSGQTPMSASPTRVARDSGGLAGLPRADWAFLHSCCSSIRPNAWALEETVSTSSRPTPFSVPSSGANWWGRRVWRRQLGWPDRSGSPRVSLPATSLQWPTGKECTAALPFLVRTPPLGLSCLIATDQEGPVDSPSHLSEKCSLVGAEGQRSQPVRQLERLHLSILRPSVNSHLLCLHPVP